MIRSWLPLDPIGGDYEALVEFFRDQRILERSLAMPGCLAAEVQVPQSRNGPAYATALWTSAEAYESWVRDPWRNSTRDQLGALLREPLGDQVAGELFDLVITVAAPPAPRIGGSQ